MPSPDTRAPDKVRSLKDLQQIKERVLSETTLRADGYRVRVTVHTGTCGIAAGAGDVLDALKDELAASGRRDIRLTTSGCIGVCVQEPVMTVEVINTLPVIYSRLDGDKARLIFREHALGGNVVTPLALGRGRQ